ncbi:hypothetical protein [Mesomycoplasma ovipneumoniae]
MRPKFKKTSSCNYYNKTTFAVIQQKSWKNWLSLLYL